jgi:hypothetical protein
VTVQGKTVSRALPGWERAGLAAIILLGTGLRFAAPDGKTIWFDEAFSRWLAQQSPAALVGWVATIDQHPPLYYLLLAGWLRMVGDEIGALRLFSAMVGVLAIPLVAVAARRLGGREVGWIAGLVMAVSPFQVQYGQEMRMYALLNLAVAILLLAATRLLTTPLPNLGTWALLVGAQAAALWTHNTALLLIVGALNLGVAAAWWWGRSTEGTVVLPGLHRPHFWRQWWLGQLAVLLLWLPWGPAFLAQARAVDADFWIALPTAWRVWEGFNTLAAAHVPAWWPFATLWGWVGVGAALVGLVRLGPRNPRTWLLAALWLLPPLLEVLVSVRRPIFHEHTLIWTLIPYAVLVGAGAASRPRMAWRAAAVALLIAYHVPGLYGYFVEFQKEPWEQAAAYVADRALPGDLVLFHATWAQLTFDAYYPADAPEILRAGVPSELFASGAIEPRMTVADLPHLSGLLAGRERVWLVYTHWWYTDPDGLLPAALGQFGRTVDRAEWMGIEVWLMEAE